MKNTFRFTLSEQDYILFEKFNHKRTVRPIYIMIMLAIIAFEAYFYIKFRMPGYIMTCVFFLCVEFLIYWNRSNNGCENRVRRYIQNDKTYLKPQEISVDRKGIELTILSNEDEIQFKAIYPYSLMSVIFETDHYFYFVINNEVKILPKRDIPNEMHGEVLRLVKNNKNRIYVK